MNKVAQTPRRRIEYRHFVAGREVTPEAFLEALQAAGGTATVEVLDLGPAPEPGYALTERGRRALAQEGVGK